jgi:hypothetical protein
MAVAGDGSGRRAVHAATTDKLRRILPDIESNITKDLSVAAGVRTRAWIKEIWSGDVFS